MFTDERTKTKIFQMELLMPWDNSFTKCFSLLYFSLHSENALDFKICSLKYWYCDSKLFPKLLNKTDCRFYCLVIRACFQKVKTM